MIFCRVAAFYLNKARKADLITTEALKTRRVRDIDSAVREACADIVDMALSKAIYAINAPKAEGYLVTASSDAPKSYAPKSYGYGKRRMRGKIVSFIA